MLQVTYSGRGLGLPRYCCKQGNVTHGYSVCIRFGASRPDQAIAERILLAVQPLAVEAAFVAQQRVQEQQQQRAAALHLEHEQETRLDGPVRPILKSSVRGSCPAPGYS